MINNFYFNNQKYFFIEFKNNLYITFSNNVFLLTPDYNLIFFLHKIYVFQLNSKKAKIVVYFHIISEFISFCDPLIFFKTL